MTLSEKKERAKKIGVSVGQLLLADLVDTLTNAERVELRKEMERSGMTNLPRNLFFNYATQEWVEESA